LASVDGDGIASNISDAVNASIPEDAYFVDTPNLRMNPMIGESQVCFIDNSIRPPRVTHESISKTSFREIPYSVWSVRLYIHKNTRVKEKG